MGMIVGTENPAEEDDRVRVAVSDKCGGSYCITQKWIHKHDVISSSKGQKLHSLHTSECGEPLGNPVIYATSSTPFYCIIIVLLFLFLLSFLLSLSLSFLLSFLLSVSLSVSLSLYSQIRD